MSPHAVAEALPDEVGLTYYAEEVLPLLEAHCFKCHGGGRAKGGLDLTSTAALLKGGDTGPAYDVSNPDGSFLLEMLSYKDELHEMPPAGKLDDAEIAIFREWLRMGAPMPAMPDDAAHAAERLAHDSPYDTEINEKTRNWWSYRPVERPAVPRVGDAAWADNPIDAFIHAGLEARGLQPVGEASRPTLIRRATYDLTGLPPTPEEVTAFVNDEDPKAYERLVDRLLNSPHYGEKWGRHWLDLVRYAETNGYERDNPKPHIWRYRDYVIQSFNEDKPYDRFVREQLAGDEMDDGGRDGIIATGFYRLGLWDDEPVHIKELYGIDEPRTDGFGRKCLLARLLAERGVRYIQVYSGGAHNDDNWDAHGDLYDNHNYHAGNTDKPIAGLLKDLNQRGLLDETLVIWGGEFGRQPTAKCPEGTGRDHNSAGFTMWMAGGGIKGGVSVGQTDELGSRAVEDRFHVKNLHATVLHQMGLDPNVLSYFYNGLDQKLVGVEGAEVIKPIIA